MWELPDAMPSTPKYPLYMSSSAIDTTHQSRPQPKLSKSSSTNQMDLLMSEMKNNPRAMLHLAPKLEHNMKRIQEKGETDSQDGSEAKKSAGFGKSLSSKLKKSDTVEPKQTRRGLRDSSKTPPVMRGKTEKQKKKPERPKGRGRAKEKWREES